MKTSEMDFKAVCLFVRAHFFLYFYFMIHTLSGYNHLNKRIMTCNLSCVFFLQERV